MTMSHSPHAQEPSMHRMTRSPLAFAFAPTLLALAWLLAPLATALAVQRLLARWPRARVGLAATAV